MLRVTRGDVEDCGHSQSAEPKCSVSMRVKVPALPSLHSSSIQSELDHNGLKQAEAERERNQFPLCKNGRLLSVSCSKENVKNRWKVRGDQFGTTQQKKNLHLSGECHRCPLSELSCFTLLHSSMPLAKYSGITAYLQLKQLIKFFSVTWGSIDHVFERPDYAYRDHHLEWII